MQPQQTAAVSDSCPFYGFNAQRSSQLSTDYFAKASFYTPMVFHILRYDVREFHIQPTVMPSRNCYSQRLQAVCFEALCRFHGHTRSTRACWDGNFGEAAVCILLRSALDTFACARGIWAHTLSSPSCAATAMCQ